MFYNAVISWTMTVFWKSPPASVFGAVVFQMLIITFKDDIIIKTKTYFIATFLNCVLAND